MTKIYHIDDMSLPAEYRRIVHESGHEKVGDTVEDAIQNGVSLFKADLRGANLSGFNFTGGNFQGAVMTGAKLVGSNLSGCDFSMANLSAADLTGADISFARINTVGRADYVIMSGNYAIIHAGFGYPVFISDQVVNFGSLAPMTPQDALMIDEQAALAHGGHEFADNLARFKALIAFHLNLQ